MQCGIKRTVFDLQHILRPSLDSVRNGMSVRRPQNQCLEDKHVQSPLEHFALQRRFASWHLAYNILHSIIDRSIQTLIRCTRDFVSKSLKEDRVEQKEVRLCCAVSPNARAAQRTVSQIRPQLPRCGAGPLGPPPGFRPASRSEEYVSELLELAT
jgi:hypothetical protein